MTYLQEPPPHEIVHARRQERAPTMGQRALLQMSVTLGLLAAAVAALLVWKGRVVMGVYLADPFAMVLNGLIVALFVLGLVRLFQGLRHYAREEREVNRFLRMRSDGMPGAAAFDDLADDSIMARRYFTIRGLYERGIPIDHGAISAIMVAEESLYQSFPRFVNNVLILTGVFGTVTSLIIALVGASDVIQTAVPGEGMGLMLLGMNTALTTTATAIVCFFFFTYFYQKLGDVQSYLFSRLERATLLYLVPEFAFDTDAVNHETRRLVEEVRGLTQDLRTGLGDLQRSTAALAIPQHERLKVWSGLAAGQEEQVRRLEGLGSQLEELHRVLVEGFRLR
ncbi:MAG: hypothetical protein R6X25_07880 [Candidatus Krumholzibacteriia bacterium]